MRGPDPARWHETRKRGCGRFILVWGVLCWGLITGGTHAAVMTGWFAWSEWSLQAGDGSFRMLRWLPVAAGDARVVDAVADRRVRLGRRRVVVD